jgi:hypothetical protein
LLLIILEMGVSQTLSSQVSLDPQSSYLSPPSS